MIMIMIPNSEYLKTTISNAILEMKKSNTMQSENTEPSASDHTTTWLCLTQEKNLSSIIGITERWIYKSQEAAKQSDT